MNDLSVTGFGLALWGALLCIVALFVDGATGDVLSMIGAAIALVGAFLSVGWIVLGGRMNVRPHRRAGRREKSNVCLNFGCCPEDVTGPR